VSGRYWHLGASTTASRYLAIPGSRCFRRTTSTWFVAVAMYAVPHAVFHFLHLEGFPPSDAVAQTMGIALHLVVIGLVGLLLWRDRERKA
jgi:hypothetical protein